MSRRGFIRKEPINELSHKLSNNSVLFWTEVAGESRNCSELYPRAQIPESNDCFQFCRKTENCALNLPCSASFCSNAILFVKHILDCVHKFKSNFCGQKFCVSKISTLLGWVNLT